MDSDDTVLQMDGATVEAVLRGGPPGVPGSIRIPLEPALDRIKVPHHNGYEHFELDPTTAHSDPMHFSWVMRTRIAE